MAQAIQGTPIPEGFAKEIEIPRRPPLFCLGCPHRAVFYVLKKLMKSDVVALGDIGCYTLSALPPLTAIHSCLCMGAGISMAHGTAQAMAAAALLEVETSTKRSRPSSSASAPIMASKCFGRPLVWRVSLGRSASPAPDLRLVMDRPHMWGARRG